MSIHPGTILNLRLFGECKVHAIDFDSLTGERVAKVFTKTAQLVLSIRYCKKVAVR